MHIQKCASKMHHTLFGKALRIRDKIYKKNWPENYSKSTKIAITVRKFSKISGEAYPPDPPSPFLVSQSASNLFRRKKNALEKCENYGPLSPLFKISRYATGSKYAATNKYQ